MELSSVCSDLLRAELQASAQNEGMLLQGEGGRYCTRGLLLLLLLTVWEFGGWEVLVMERRGDAGEGLKAGGAGVAAAEWGEEEEGGGGGGGLLLLISWGKGRGKKKGCA